MLNFHIWQEERSAGPHRGRDRGPPGSGRGELQHQLPRGAAARDVPGVQRRHRIREIRPSLLPSRASPRHHLRWPQGELSVLSFSSGNKYSVIGIFSRLVWSICEELFLATTRTSCPSSSLTPTASWTSWTRCAALRSDTRSTTRSMAATQPSR